MGDDDTVLDGNSSSDRTASQSPLAKACGALDMQCKTSKSMLERTCIILCVFAALLFVNRLYQMRRIRGWFGLEEGMICILVATVMGREAIVHGIGQQEGALHRSQSVGTSPLLDFYIYRIFYTLAVGFNKLAFLLLYLRIFAAKTIRFICWTATIAVCCAMAIFITCPAVRCIPQSSDAYHRAFFAGECGNNGGLRWSWTGYNITTYLVLLIMPLTVILRMPAPVRDRIKTSIIFTIGLFVVASSAVRVAALTHHRPLSLDGTWNVAPVLIWSQVEATVGLIAVCLLSMCPLIFQILPHRFSHAVNEDGHEHPTTACVSTKASNSVSQGSQTEKTTIIASKRRGRFWGLKRKKHAASSALGGITVTHDIHIVASNMPPDLADFYTPRGRMKARSSPGLHELE